MVHVAFDTLKFVEKLRTAGVPEAQAKALCEAQTEVFAEALDTTLATKTDLIKLEANLDVRIDRVEEELKHVKWVLGFIVACLISIMVKTFF